MFKKISSSIPPRYFGLAALVAVALCYIALFRYDAYGIDEGAARGLLLTWSIADQIANPTTLFGAPDLRALFFMPLTFHWVGDITAAKMLTLFLMLGLALLLYQWAERSLGAETALIGTGLLLIAPISVMQVDAVDKAPYLLLAFYLGHWLEGRFRSSNRLLPSDFFLLLMVAAVAVSLHPAGLALPAAIAWQMRRQGMDRSKMRYLATGLAVTTVVIALVRMGWQDLGWLASPLPPLASALAGPQFGPQEASDSLGMFVLGLTLITMFFSLARLSGDIFTLSLTTAIIIGALAADSSWAMLCMTYLLYFGTRLAIDLNRRLHWRQGIAGERGLVIVLIVASATTFMVGDRYIRFIASHEVKSPSDTVISKLAVEADNHDKPFLAASQWPARTMLACRRDVLPLPPAARDAQTLMENIRGVTHLAFDYRDKRNKSLARQTAMLSEQLETMELLPGGVILKARNTKKP